MELPEATKIRLKTQHLILEELINNLSDHELNQEPEPGKWTIRQQIAHLVRYQDMFFERINTIMINFNAVFSPYVAADDVKFQEVLNLSLPQLFSELNSRRETINSFLLNLNSGELSRKGRHTQLGYFSIALWAEFFLLHEAHHLYSVFRMSNRFQQNRDY